MVMKSWESNETLEELAEKQRKAEIVEGVIRSVRSMKLPKEVDGVLKSVEEDTLIVALPGGVTGYCPASEFREREFKSYNQFMSQVEPFIVTKLDLENQVAFLSANAANNQLRVGFWERIEALAEQKALENEVFEGVVTGYSQKNGVIYVRIDGQDTYMFVKEWSWSERDVIDAQQGEKIEVKIVLFDKEKQLVRVSRRLALPDPFAVLDSIQVGDMIAGKVSAIHPIHGIFVEVENGVELKGSKVRQIPDPDVGDFVTCRVRKIDAKERKGRVVILNYPRGKRKKKNLGSFLFE